MNTNIIKTDWKKFKDFLDKNSNNAQIIYRGHADPNWVLKSTLARITGEKEINFDNYLTIVREVYNDKNFRNSLPCEYINKNPLKIFIKIDQDKRTLGQLITLRHLGFPSPLLDWTECPYIAAFFALTNDLSVDKYFTIYQLEYSNIKPSQYNHIQIIAPNTVDDYIAKLGYNDVHPRHEKQKSWYTWCNYQDTISNCVTRFIILDPIDMLDHSDTFKLTKYYIENSKEIRISILNELINIKKITFYSLKGESFSYENSLLKDIEIKNFWLRK